MQINQALISRSLIALLFVVAGIQKLMNFSDTSGFIGSLGIPLPMLVLLVVIIIEIPVALAYAFGYKTCFAGWILIAFTALTILVVHKNIFGADMVNALKNVAIIGGIMLGISSCTCGVCPASKKNSTHSHNS